MTGQPEDDAPRIVTVAEQPAAVVRGDGIPMADLPGFFDRAFGALGSTVAGQPGLVTGPPFARYDRPPTESADLEAGFPVSRPVEPSGAVAPSTLPGGRAVRLVHRGGYEELGTSWERLVTWAEEQGLTRAPVMWEVYLTEPTPDADPSTMRTELNWLLEG
jgi:effector-binding domain-containing protein